MTEAQQGLFNAMAETPLLAMYVRGPQVRVARGLVALGLASLEDNGYLPGDPERWFCELTAHGRALALEHAGTPPR